MSINITLNQLISELSDIEETKKPVQQKYENSYLSDYFRKILGDELYRHGTIQHFKSSTRTLNVSLFYSILYLLDNDFENMDEYKQIDNINILVNKMCSDINSNALITKYNYKEVKIKKIDLLNEISNYLNTNKVIKFLSDYFDINIFICNLELNKLYCACNNNFYNKYKNNIIISQINKKSFEPITTKDHKIFSLNHQIIEKLLNNSENIIPLYGNDFIIKSDLDINNELEYEQKMENADVQETKDADEQKMENADVQETDNVEEQEIENADVQETDNVEEQEIENADVQETDNVEEQETDDDQETDDEQKTYSKKPKYSLKNKLSELQKIAQIYNINLKKKINGKDKNKTKSEIILDLDLEFSK